MDYIAKLASFADKPGFDWKSVIIGFTAGQFVFTNYLRYRQYQVLKKDAVPKELKGIVKEETYKKTQEYGRAKSRFGFVSSAYDLVQKLVIFKYDLLPVVYNWAGRAVANAPSWIQKFGTAQSIAFFLSFNFIGSLLDLPISIYSTFVLEEKFGFNKQTARLFATDFIKSQLISVVLGAPITSAALWIIEKFGDKFFFYLWLFVLGVQVLLIAVYPIVIQPLFNKVTPMEEGELKTSVVNLAKKLQFPLTKLYVIDESLRSSHSNAYFYGLPWSKRIVIYDTLINQSSISEVTAVLAHEFGHWSLSHTTKMFVTNQAYIFSIFVLFSAFFRNVSLYKSFGFATETPSIVGFILFGDILNPLTTVLTFGMNLISRKYEYEADAFAAELGLGDDLAKALITIHVENLGSMEADWLFSSFHHSHPLLTERLRALEYKQKKQE